MSSREVRISQILQQTLAPQYMELENESSKHSVPPNSETHFRILLVSDKFEGQSRIERQRWVNKLLAEELQNGLHALTQKTLTPAEWELQKDQPFKSPDCQGGSRHDKNKS